MNFQAKMFNRKASDLKSKPDQILDTLALQPGQSVADIGAGGGYFSLRFAEAVGDEGHVFAVEIDSELVEFVRQAAKEKRLDNVDTILVTENQLTLPERSLDLVFMRNVTHDIDNRMAYFRKFKVMLKPEGRIAIIDWRKGVPQEQLEEEMKEVGYRLIGSLDFLPEQSFMIFSL